MKQLLPYATKQHGDDRCQARDAWARASSFFPELASARRLVELLLVWKPATGNLERRFRRFREIRCPQRAPMLDTTVEQCIFVEQAPPSSMLRDGNKLFFRYITDVLKLHDKLHGRVAPRKRLAERRDKGVPRAPAQTGTGIMTDAAFGRKRRAAIDEVEAATPS